MQRQGLAATAALLALVANAALAQGDPARNGPPQPKPKVACAADVQRLCPNQPAGKGSRKCLKEHKSEVSAQCSAAVRYAHDMRKQRKAAKASQAPPSDSRTPPPPGGMAPPK